MKLLLLTMALTLIAGGAYADCTLQQDCMHDNQRFFDESRQEDEIHELRQQLKEQQYETERLRWESDSRDGE